MAATVTGKDAILYIMNKGAGIPPTKGVGTWGVSDFSITLDRGTVEQELVGQPGNYFDQGALSIEGSFTNCKFAASGNSDSLLNIIDGTGTNEYVRISGSVGSTLPITWYFVSCQITSYEVAIGDADTITEASMDFQVINPHQTTYATGHLKA